MTKQYELYEAREHSGIPNTTSSPSPEERGRVSKARGCLARQGVGRKRAVGQEVAGKERCSGEGSQREGWKKLNSGTQPDGQIDKLSCCLASLLSSNTIWINCPVYAQNHFSPPCVQNMASTGILQERNRICVNSQINYNLHLIITTTMNPISQTV